MSATSGTEPTLCEAWEAATEEAVAAERAAVVAYLRAEAARIAANDRWVAAKELHYQAAAVERGDHRRGEGGGDG